MTKKQLKLIINVYQNYFNDFVNVTDKDIDKIYFEIAKKDIKQNINKREIAVNQITTLTSYIRNEDGSINYDYELMLEDFKYQLSQLKNK